MLTSCKRSLRESGLEGIYPWEHWRSGQPHGLVRPRSVYPTVLIFWNIERVTIIVFVSFNHSSRYLYMNEELNGTIPYSIGKLRSLWSLYSFLQALKLEILIIRSLVLTSEKIDPFEPGFERPNSWEHLRSLQRPAIVRLRSVVETINMLVKLLENEFCEWGYRDCSFAVLLPLFSSRLRYLHSNPGLNGTIPESIGNMRSLWNLYEFPSKSSWIRRGVQQTFWLLIDFFNAHCRQDRFTRTRAWEEQSPRALATSPTSESCMFVSIAKTI